MLAGLGSAALILSDGPHANAGLVVAGPLLVAGLGSGMVVVRRRRLRAQAAEAEEPARPVQDAHGAPGPGDPVPCDEGGGSARSSTGDGAPVVQRSGT